MRCDDADGDGFGVGPDCACSGEAVDCDDGDPSVGETASVGCCNGGTRACVDGVWRLCSTATGETCDGADNDCNGIADDLGEFTCGFGACKKTVAACSGGVLGVCVPDAPKTNVDDCDGVDEDCDGAVDEDCADCFHVATDGDDTLAAANGGKTPFRNVQTAIDFADTHRSVSNRVCVAAGPACGATATYAGPTGADLTMREGVSVLGNYESTCWSRCVDSTTRLAPQTKRGIVFPPTIFVETVLDGFAIDRVYDPAQISGITVDGARGVVLSHLFITPGDPGPQISPAQQSSAVTLTNGALATLARSRIERQRGIENFAVRAIGSTVLVEDNCPVSPSASTGRCWSVCAVPGPQIGSAILLENAIGSRIERSALCTFAQESFQARGRPLSVRGRGAGIVIRANVMELESHDAGGTETIGLRFEECGGDAPWLVDNEPIRATVRSGSFETVRATGDCHPVIEANASIGNEVPSFWTQATGIACVGGSRPSRCVIAKTSGGIAGANEPGAPEAAIGFRLATGVACRNGSCGRIEQNKIHGLITLQRCQIAQCQRSGTGMTMSGGSPLVVRNTISFGYGPGLTGAARFFMEGLRGSTEERVQYNAIVPGFVGASAALEANSIADVQWGGGGTVRGNCITTFNELGTTADPLVFENNDVHRYLDEGTSSLTAQQVNALTDMITSGNDDWPCTRPVGPTG